MTWTTTRGRVAGAVAVAACAGAVLAGCGGSGSGDKSGSMAKMKMGSATTNAATGSGGSMAGMKMGGSGSGGAVNGIKPIPTRTLASAMWQGMQVKAMAMTAIPFEIYDGTRERSVKVPPHASFHLMVMLDDARSHEPIPYATVWATFRKSGRVVYDERQWPMISEYMGPHYGNDVSLPGAGRYQLSLLVSPPVSARHVEYKHVWLKPHRVNLSFTWNGKT